MKRYFLNALLIFVALLVGSIATSLNSESTFKLLAVGLLILSVVTGMVNYRHKNYVGIFFPTFKDLHYKLSKTEISIAVFGVALMASPYIFMLAVLAWS
ncbi:MAG: hypothetical protein COA90_09090 [Gammaproteobacteria bacterium]|nr:MAG: hypothetical protein COA90_09090 [Gammaproteobacteria bacterium]